ncbi:MAG TPA: FAD-dependent oxidoreductase, partial [Alphaproteobacteria bacterium]|nr:FAD-dependent oxidoreductase [Alphaproteobacteria bacterium]
MAKDKTTWEIRMPKFSQLKSDLDVDVLIIGGGITGIICAYLLSKEKLKVALIEKNRLCSGATVATTAFLTRIIDTDLRKLVKMYGYSQTEDLIKAHQYAIDQFENIIKKNKIDCEFMRCPNYSYAIDEKSAMDLIEENRIARSFGIKTEFSRSLELGFDNYGYIKIENQAKFHPLKFLSSLAKIAKDNGVMIFENTEAKEIQDKYKIITNRGEISARKIIIATYAPFDNKIYFKKAFYDSYIIEAKIPKGMIPEGIYEDTMDPYHYFRIDPQGKHDRMIIGGEDHRSDIPVSDSKS